MTNKILLYMFFGFLAGYGTAVDPVTTIKILATTFILMVVGSMTQYIREAELRKASHKQCRQSELNAIGDR